MKIVDFLQDTHLFRLQTDVLRFSDTKLVTILNSVAIYKSLQSALLCGYAGVTYSIVSRINRTSNFR